MDRIKIEDLRGLWLSTNQIKGRNHCLKIGMEGNSEFAELTLLSPNESFQTTNVVLSDITASNTRNLIIDDSVFEVKHIKIATKGISTEYLEEITLDIRGQEVIFFRRNI